MARGTMSALPSLVKSTPPRTFENRNLPFATSVIEGDVMVCSDPGSSGRADDAAGGTDDVDVGVALTCAQRVDRVVAGSDVDMGAALGQANNPLAGPGAQLDREVQVQVGHVLARQQLVERLEPAVIVMKTDECHLCAGAPSDDRRGDVAVVDITDPVVIDVRVLEAKGVEDDDFRTQARLAGRGRLGGGCRQRAQPVGGVELPRRRAADCFDDHGVSGTSKADACLTGW